MQNSTEKVHFEGNGHPSLPPPVAQLDPNGLVLLLDNGLLGNENCSKLNLDAFKNLMDNFWANEANIYKLYQISFEVRRRANSSSSKDAKILLASCEKVDSATKLIIDQELAPTIYGDLIKEAHDIFVNRM